MNCGLFYMKKGKFYFLLPLFMNSFKKRRVVRMEKPVLSIDKYDKDNQPLQANFFDNIVVGDKVNLWDGEYEYDNKIYRVLNEEVIYIVNAETDENQMSIFDMMEATS